MNILYGIILGIITVIYINTCFINPREIKRQGRETRRLIVELANLESISRRGPLHEASVLFDDDFIVTNVTGETAARESEVK